MHLENPLLNHGKHSLAMIRHFLYIGEPIATTALKIHKYPPKLYHIWAKFDTVKQSFGQS